jgi:hypothetical protein
MNIQAIWEDGVLRPTQPLTLKHDLVTIQVPDEEIAANELEPTVLREKPYVLPPEAIAIADRMTAEFERIRNAPLPPDEDLPPVTQKQLDRIAAFAMREDR